MEDRSPSEQIDQIIKMNVGWKGELLAGVRSVVKHADPNIVEEIKWKMLSNPSGNPVWSHNGIICVAVILKSRLKVIFFKGALLNDSGKLFNASLKSKTDRAIELQEGDSLNETAFIDLVQQAVRLNEANTGKH